MEGAGDLGKTRTGNLLIHSKMSRSAWVEPGKVGQFWALRGSEIGGSVPSYFVFSQLTPLESREGRAILGLSRGL